jgi:hypothetical protein
MRGFLAALCSVLCVICPVLIVIVLILLFIGAAPSNGQKERTHE